VYILSQHGTMIHDHNCELKLTKTCWFTGPAVLQQIVPHELKTAHTRNNFKQHFKSFDHFKIRFLTSEYFKNYLSYWHASNVVSCDNLCSRCCCTTSNGTLTLLCIGRTVNVVIVCDRKHGEMCCIVTGHHTKFPAYERVVLRERKLLSLHLKETQFLPHLV